MSAEDCCGSEAHHCPWCAAHFVVVPLAEDHAEECEARPQVGAA